MSFLSDFRYLVSRFKVTKILYQLSFMAYASTYVLHKVDNFVSQQTYVPTWVLHNVDYTCFMAYLCTYLRLTQFRLYCVSWHTYVATCILNNVEYIFLHGIPMYLLASYTSLYCVSQHMQRHRGVGLRPPPPVTLVYISFLFHF